MTAPPQRLRLPLRRRRRLGLGALVVLFGLILLVPALVQLAAEWPWFSALGYGRVFTTRLVAQAVLGLGVGAVAWAFLYANLWVAQRGLVTMLAALALTAVVLLYLVRRDVVVFRRQVTVEPSARVHLAGLIALLFLLTALRVYFVGLPGLLYSTTGPLVGASYSDLHAELIGLRLVALAALAGGALVLWGATSHRLARNTLVAVGVYLGVWLLGVALYPTIVQRLVVAPNELVKETPQLARHIAATRRAWGLDSVVTRELTGESRLTERDIRANRPTIDNVRLWDRDPLLQTFGQLQEIRTYYDFVSVDDDRYWIDGQYRQVLLSPRELNSASLPTRTFINE